MSGKLTPAACTSISTSLPPGCGDGNSSTRMDSGGPNSRTTTAFISARAPTELLEAMHAERRHPLYRPGLLGDFADVQIALAIGPDPVRRDEVARQHRVLAADLAHDVCIGIAHGDARN